MSKKQSKKKEKLNLQEKFEELKIQEEQFGFQKFMKFHEEISSYSKNNQSEEQVLIGLDNSTEIINS